MDVLFGGIMFLLKKKFWKVILYCILVCCVSYTAFEIFKVSPPAEDYLQTDSPVYLYPTVYHACFAPRYNGVIFNCHFGNILGIFVMNMQGRVFKTLYQSEGGCGGGPPFTLSPDGRWMAMVLSSDIALMDLDSGHIETILKTPEYEHDPAFSPDSKRLFFIRSKHYEATISHFPGYSQGSLLYYDMTTKKEVYVLGDNLPSKVYPNPLPDNEHVLIQTWYERLTPEGLKDAPMHQEGHNLWLININDVQKSRPVVPDMMPFIQEYPEESRKWILNLLSDGRGPDLVRPVLSRDGKYLAFMWFMQYIRPASGRDQDYRAFIAPMSDLKPIVLADQIECLKVHDISPDDQYVLLDAFDRRETRTHPFRTDLWIVRRDGTGLREIVPDFMDHKVRKRCKLIIPRRSGRGLMRF